MTSEFVIASLGSLAECTSKRVFSLNHAGEFPEAAEEFYVPKEAALNEDEQAAKEKEETRAKSPTEEEEQVQGFRV